MHCCKLLRVLSATTFCVMYCKTRAVLCIECENLKGDVYSRMTMASPFCPLNIGVDFGSYDVNTGVFKKSDIILVDCDQPQKKKTQYKKLCI